MADRAAERYTPGVLASLLVGAALGAQDFEGRSFYFGDLHVHTAASADGYSSDIGPELGRDCSYGRVCGEALKIVESARAAGLDFMAITDHSNGPKAGDPRAWAEVVGVVLDGNDPAGGFITLAGSEVHFASPDGGELGHQSLYFFGTNEDLRGLQMSDTQFDGERTDLDCEDRWPWMAQLQERFGPAMLVPHHPAAIGTGVVDWSCYDRSWQPVVEVYSHHGNSLRMDADYDPLVNGTAEKGTVHYALGPEGRCGEQPTPGFFASTDNHDSLPGSTCASVGYRYAGGVAVVVLDEGERLSRQAIYDALYDRRTYATSGPMIPALVDYYSEGVWIGTSGWELPMSPGEELEAIVRVPPEVEPYIIGATLVSSRGDIDLLSLGGGRYRYRTTDAPEWFYPRLRINGRAWYGEPCEDAGEDYEERIWLSPSRILWTTPCGGCSARPASRSLSGVLLLLWALLRRGPRSGAPPRRR